MLFKPEYGLKKLKIGNDSHGLNLVDNHELNPYPKIGRPIDESFQSGDGRKE